MSTLSILQQVAIVTPPVLLAITVHEAAHAWMARYCGDPTAAQLGRVSFNPLRHVDPIGTLLVPSLLLLTTNFLFGWAKPVPINWRRLRRPRRDIALVALAGPAANLFMALVWSMAIHLDVLLGQTQSWLIKMGATGLMINLMLMLFNLIPIPPLDGGRVLNSLLPTPVSRIFSRIEPYGLILVLILLLSGGLSQALSAALLFIFQLWPMSVNAQIITAM